MEELKYWQIPKKDFWYIELLIIMNDGEDFNRKRAIYLFDEVTGDFIGYYDPL